MAPPVFGPVTPAFDWMMPMMSLPLVLLVAPVFSVLAEFVEMIMFPPLPVVPPVELIVTAAEAPSSTEPAEMEILPPAPEVFPVDTRAFAVAMVTLPVVEIEILPPADAARLELAR